MRATKLVVMFAMRVPSDGYLVAVDVLEGAPLLGMRFTVSGSNGEWKVTGFSTMPADFCLTHPRAMNLCMLPLVESIDLRDGMILLNEI